MRKEKLRRAESVTNRDKKILKEFTTLRVSSIWKIFLINVIHVTFIRFRKREKVNLRATSRHGILEARFHGGFVSHGQFASRIMAHKFSWPLN